LGQYCAQYCPNIVHNIAPTLAQYCLPAGMSLGFTLKFQTYQFSTAFCLLLNLPVPPAIL